MSTTVRSVVTPVEPSVSMRAQRPSHLSVAIGALPETSPIADHQFDASMAIFTVHQWTGLERCLAEMRRVPRRQPTYGGSLRLIIAE